MIVVDASVAILGLLAAGTSRELLGTRALAAPHLVDAEVTHALRRRVLAGSLPAREAAVALEAWRWLGVRRFGSVGHLPRIWQLRANVTAYDATYVALAEALGSDLATADARLAAAPGPTCAIRVLRS